jgi:hypothetical protein
MRENSLTRNNINHHHHQQQQPCGSVSGYHRKGEREGREGGRGGKRLQDRRGRREERISPAVVVFIGIVMCGIVRNNLHDQSHWQHTSLHHIATTITMD